ncbi:MAG: hypothetical protein JNK35_04800 [Phycisphaerae bacterium]|nr:hypothetical protein [Phycisphaerae bacterium]
MLAVLWTALVLALVAGPALGAWAVLLARLWPGARTSELLLAGALALSASIVATVAILGSVPASLITRPLGALPGLTWLMCVGAMVFLWVNRRFALHVWRRAWASFTAARAGAPAAVRVLVAAALTWHAVVALAGAWSWPVVIDDVRYHVSQAVQPFQDGRLGPTHAGVVWADSYPRGVALLWSWSLMLTGHDAGFRLVNSAAALVLALAAVVAARRLGADRPAAALAGAVILPTPIVSYLSGINYVDLPIAAFLASAAALAIPDHVRPRRDAPTLRIALVGLGLVLAMWAKFQPAPAAITVALTALAMAARPRAGGPLRARASIRAAAILGLAASVAGVPYLFTWVRFGSPVYPLQLRLGSFVLFSGPMDPDTIGASAQMPWAPRFARFWSDWFAPLGPETPGSFGPAFTLLLLPAALTLALAQIGRLARAPAGPRGLVLLVALLAAVLVVPLYHWPRYSLWLLPMASAAFALAWSWSPAVIRAGSASLALILAGGSATLYARDAWPRAAEVIALAADAPPIDPLSSNAARLVADRQEFSPSWASVGVRAAVRTHAKAGDLVVHATPTPSVVLTDPRYTYRVHHRPIRPWPAWWADGFDPRAQAEGVAPDAPGLDAQWRAGLESDRVRLAVVIRDGPEDRALEQARPAHFHIVYEDPPSRGVWRLRVYAIDDRAPGTAR